jgi:perosamine synthetase
MDRQVAEWFEQKEAYGQPPRIPQHEPLFGHEEADAVRAYVMGGGWLTEHTKTRELEAALASYTGAAHCIMLPNGTLSLTVAALALGLTPGTEVIVPCYSMIASANAFKMLAITPIFVDVEPDTLCLDIDKVERALTFRTRAVVLVTANGREPAAGIEAWERFCKGKGLCLIEDAAQSLGARFRDGRHCGRAGVVGSFSFSAPKIISTGQGGALITDDDGVAHKIRLLKDFGRAAGGTDLHPTLGYNMKFTDLQAVVGIEQAKKLPARVERKLAIGARYRAGLAGIEQVRMFQQTSVPWFIDVLVDRRDELRAHLAAHGIGTRVMYPPIQAQRCYARGGSFPVAEMVGTHGLWLPSSVQLTDEEVDRVCGEVRSFYGH